MFANADRLRELELRNFDYVAEFAKNVEEGLTRRGQKSLSASWLYDEVGSALFEVITLLPEYGLTRADSRLLQQAAKSIVREADFPKLVIELGSGTGTKTRYILSAAAAADRGEIVYRPIDISGAALAACASILSTDHRIQVEPIESTYDEGIREALRFRNPAEKAMVLFLGSTIGNFSRTDALVFLRKIRSSLRKGDSLLLGADLVKSPEILLRAYDDPTGVTAAFNMYLLARINRELDGHFDLSLFSHQARFNEKRSRVEMHLQSKVAQSVRIDAIGSSIAFRAGETIWTESSHKFKAEDVVQLAERAGWRCSRQWIDREWGFAETLFVV